MKPAITMRRMLTRRWLTVGSVVVVTGVAITGWAWARGSAPVAPRLGTASLGTIRQAVSATGTIEPTQQANLSFAVAGQVTTITNVGQQVKAGQTLATVDAASLPSQVAQAKAAVAASEARVAADQTSGVSAAQINADNAAVTSANAQLAVAQQNLSRASLTAPFDGTVAAVNLTLGQQVSGGSSAPSSTGSSGGGPTAAGGSGTASASNIASTTAGSASTAQVVVISTGSYVVDATVDDTEVSQLRSGDQAVVVPNGSTDQIFGTVSSIGMIGSQTSGITTYPVTIDVTGKPGNLPIGATAQISIVIKQLNDVVVIPRAAVHSDGERSVVYEMENGQQVAHPVTIGLSAGGQTQITSGLAAGTRIVLPPASTATGPGGTGRGGGFGGGGFGGGGGGLGGGGLGGGAGRVPGGGTG